MKINFKNVRRFLNLDLQSRLALGFLIATCLTGVFATIVSIWTINRSTIAEVQNRVRQDINTAKLIYNNKLDKILSVIQFTAEASDFAAIMKKRDLSGFEQHMRALIRQGVSTPSSNGFPLLDMLTLVDENGTVLYRAANPREKGDSIREDALLRQCMETKKPVVSTEIMSYHQLVTENPSLADRAEMDIIKTPLAAEIGLSKITDGLVMKASYPILDKKSGRFLGALIGGVLINKDNEIVDKIRETVYHDEKYQGQEVGVATIFQGGVRISTNVMTKDNRRAIGTVLSKEVYDRVIKQGKDWIGRAFVVKDWYITTYTPIYNIEGKVVGILYTGILEAKYRDIQKQTVWLNLAVTTLGMTIAFILSLYFGNTIIKRIRVLKKATEAIALGDLDYKLSPDNISGFYMLDEAFNKMVQSLKTRNDELQKMHRQLAISERLSALGQMASGVAHEINNPLGGILLYSNLILEDLPSDSPLRENVQKIIYQTNRCKEIVQSLLDFARAPTGDLIPIQINQVISVSLKLVKDQAIFHGIEIETKFAENIPDIRGDMSRLEEVFLNLFINAADAMKNGGKLTITTGMRGEDTVEVTVSDTGKGIDEQNLPHIFEPFFTTKETGHGTGLGLAIVYGIIKRHKGMIEVESKPGKGTTFIIRLPVYHASSPSENHS